MAKWPEFILGKPYESEIKNPAIDPFMSVGAAASIGYAWPFYRDVDGPPAHAFGVHTLGGWFPSSWRLQLGTPCRCGALGQSSGPKRHQNRRGFLYCSVADFFLMVVQSASFIAQFTCNSRPLQLS